MKTVPTVTVGIPAYNEQNTIAHLLTDIKNQKSTLYKLERVILYSDGSSDNTVEHAKSVKGLPLTIASGKARQGIAFGLNTITKMADTDILVFLDADITITDPKFIEKLIKPILKNSADLTSSAIAELTPASFVAKTLYVSMKLKTTLFDCFRGGQSAYSCHGLARGLSKKYYSRLHIPVSIGNDMYTYLDCVKNNFKYMYAREALAYYRLPETFSDHYKQSARFFANSGQMAEYFDASFIGEQTHIPLKVTLTAIRKNLRYILMHLPENVAYFCIQLYVRLSSKNINQEQAWEIASSSKSR
jgi:glycosyltransferase involved in cell wall biosynthesis